MGRLKWANFHYSMAQEVFGELKIRFPDKNNVESKVFWASLGTGPMQKQKKTAVIAKNKPLELPRSGTNAVSRVKLDIYHPYCGYGSFIRRRFISHAQFNHHRTL